MTRQNTFSIPSWSDFIARAVKGILDLPPIFNPILVWFYPELTSHPNSLNSFSIPSWSDFICCGRLRRQHPLLEFSIPSWSDFISGKCKFEAYDTLIFNPILVWFYPQSCGSVISTLLEFSIPSWSDFISRRGVAESPKRKVFNPILVWFYRPEVGDGSRHRLVFNPILVWFYRRKGRKEEVDSGWTEFSIPSWSDFINW